MRGEAWAGKEVGRMARRRVMQTALHWKLACNAFARGSWMLCRCWRNLSVCVCFCRVACVLCSALQSRM